VAIDWTSMQTLAGTIGTALGQTAPTSVRELTIYINNITSALSSIKSMESTLYAGRALGKTPHEVEDYDRALTKLSTWSSELREVLRTISYTYPLMEGFDSATTSLDSTS